MKKYSTLGIFAHANAGKTTVTENILFNTNVINKIGRVDNGDTVTDNLSVEKDRGITVRASYVSFNLGDKVVQLLDTPGHIDFSAEVERAVSVLDSAILVVSGVDGVQPQTLAIWKLLKERKIPTIIFINKLDRKGADIDRTIADMHHYLDKNLILFNRYDEEKKIIKQIDNHDLMLDILSNFDIELISKYLNDGEIDKNFLFQSFIKNYHKGNVYPILTGSALNNIGTKELITLLNEIIPIYKKQENEKFSGYVFSVKNIEGVWNSYVKVLKGKLNSRDIIKINDKDLKISKILVQKGKEQESVDFVDEGQLVILSGISIPIGTVIGDASINIQPLNYVHPLFNVTLKSADIQNLAEGLKILNIEDPYLNLSYDDITNEFSIDVIGDLHGEIILRLLKDRFGVEAVIESSSIIYKETPVSEGFGKSGYKRCSNVAIRVTPLPRGSGLKFKSEFSTDFLFAKYQKLIEKKLVQKYSKFALKGWELTDAEIAIVGGKCDNAGSESMHYNIAAPIALFRALKEAKTMLLEPEMSFDLICENDLLNLAIQECTKSSQSSVEFEYREDGMVFIHGIAPLSFTKDLPKKLNKVLSGKYSFIQHEIGYIEVQKEVNKTRLTPYVTPLKEIPFVYSQGGSLTPFDLDLDKKGGRPERIRRNKSMNKVELKSNGKPKVKKNDKNEIEEDFLI